MANRASFLYVRGMLEQAKNFFLQIEIKFILGLLNFVKSVLCAFFEGNIQVHVRILCRFCIQQTTQFNGLNFLFREHDQNGHPAVALY